MSKLINMTGWKMWEHGVPDSRLTVIKRVEDYLNPDGTYAPQWLCECSCGNHTIKAISGYDLTKKNHPTRSCGCLVKEFDEIDGVIEELNEVSGFVVRNGDEICELIA